MNLPIDISSSHELIKLLLKKLELFEQRIAEQNELIASQSKRILALEARLNKDSQNSNKPPSSDGLKKRPALDKKGDKKRGGQPGHAGKTLEMVAQAEKSVVLPLSGQCSCGCNLGKLATQVGQIRQVFDICTKLEVTEYIQQVGACSCGIQHASAFPYGVNAHVQYGSGVRALTTVLTQDCHVSVGKTRQLFIDLFEYEINQATIMNNTARCYTELEASEQVIKQAVITSAVSHYDETGLRVAGKLHWLHVACTQMYTFLFIHQKRGKEALQYADIITQVQHWVVHDCWDSYFTYQEGKRALCGAHLIRELRALEQRGSPWANLFSDLLLELYELTEQGTNQLDEFGIQQVKQLYDNIYQYADNLEPLAYNPPNKRGRVKQTDGRNLLKRLVLHKHAVLAFACHKEVPFTNNLAERALRPAKTKQKVSGCLRTFKGAEYYARIRSFIDTARKQNRNVFKEIKAVLEGKSFLLVLK